MAKISESIINGAVYEDSTEYRGVAEITLPDISQLTAEVTGAGIGGKYTSPIVGHIDSMTMTMQFRTLSDDNFKLASPVAHTLDIRVAQQNRDSKSGALGVEKIKHTVIATPIKIGMGKIAAATTADASGEYSATYFATYVEGKKMTEIDPVNYIFIINGIDYTKEIRAALGK